MIGQGLNCDEKGELADEDSEETFEEALEDKPNDENIRFYDDLFNNQVNQMQGFHRKTQGFLRLSI